MFSSKPKAANGVRTMAAYWERVQTGRCSADRMKHIHTGRKKEESGGLSEYKGGGGE